MAVGTPEMGASGDGGTPRQEIVEGGQRSRDPEVVGDHEPSPFAVVDGGEGDVEVDANEDTGPGDIAQVRQQRETLEERVDPLPTAPLVVPVGAHV